MLVSHLDNWSNFWARVFAAQILLEEKIPDHVLIREQCHMLAFIQDVKSYWGIFKKRWEKGKKILEFSITCGSYFPTSSFPENLPRKNIQCWRVIGDWKIKPPWTKQAWSGNWFTKYLRSSFGRQWDEKSNCPTCPWFLSIFPAIPNFSEKMHQKNEPCRYFQKDARATQ